MPSNTIGGLSLTYDTGITTIENDTLKALKFMNSSFLNGATDNMMNDMTLDYTNIDETKSLFAVVLKYDAFKKKYADTVNFPSINTTSGSENIYKASPSGQYTGWNGSDIAASDIVNVSRYLFTSSTASHKNLLKDLDELYVAYQLCEPEMFNRFHTSGGMVTSSDGALWSYILKNTASSGSAIWTRVQINSPIMSTTYLSTANPDLLGRSLTDYKNLDLVKFIYNLDPTRVDLFVLRRIILGTFYAAHCRLFATRYVEDYQAAVPASGSTPATAERRDTTASKCLTSFYNKLRKLNIDAESNGNYDTSSLLNSMQQSMRSYNETTDKIDVLDVEIRDAKKHLKTNLTTMDKNAAISDKAAKYKYAAIGVAGATFVGMLVLMAMPLDMRVKLQSAAGLFAIAFACVMLLNFFRARAVALRGAEGFVNLPEGMTYDTALNQITVKETMKEMFNLIIIGELRDMYRNTINMAFALKSSTLYSTLNYNQGKELVYFDDSNYRIHQAVEGADALGKIHTGRARLSTAIFMFFVQALFVVIFSLLIVMLTAEYPTLRVVGLVIMAFFAFVVFIMFLRELLARVRTDPDKMYWGTPTGALEGL